MKALLILGAVVGLVLAPSAAMANWSDNFDTYTPGTINGQGGWQGWGGSAAAAGAVVTTPFLSPPHSQEIIATSDSVHQYSGYTSGLWTYTAWQYIPGSYTGQTYFILLNQYDDPGLTDNWSMQVEFNSTANAAQVILYSGAVAGTPIPLVRDQWVEIRDVIDLTADTQSVYYNNQLLLTTSWTNGIQATSPGILNIGAVDLYGNSASSVWYDNMSLIPEPASLVLLGLGLLLVTRRR
jgi:hypothetical protein